MFFDWKKHRINYSSVKAFPKRIEVGDWIPFKSKEIVIPDYTTIGDDELLLGGDTPEYDEPVCIPFNPRKRITLVVQGDNSSGKSVLLMNLALQMHFRFGRPLVIIDPKMEFHRVISKNTNKHFNEINERFEIRPKACPYAKFISPTALRLREQGAWAHRYKGEYSLSLPMLNEIVRINPTQGINAIYKIYNTQQGDPAARELQKIFLDPNPPQNSSELNNAIRNIPKCPPTLISQHELLIRSEILGDNGINYPELLAKHKLLILEMTISSKLENTIQDVYVHNLITSMIQDRIKSVASDNKKGYTSSPFTLILDEASVFAGKDRQTADILESSLTKYRELLPDKKRKGIKTYGLDVMLVTQHMAELNDILVKESDWLIFPKISDLRDAEMLKLRGMDSVNIWDFQNMEYGDEYPKLFNAVSKDKVIKPFYPLPNQVIM